MTFTKQHNKLIHQLRYNCSNKSGHHSFNVESIFFKHRRHKSQWASLLHGYALHKNILYWGLRFTITIRRQWWFSSWINHAIYLDELFVRKIGQTFEGFFRGCLLRDKCFNLNLRLKHSSVSESGGIVSFITSLQFSWSSPATYESRCWAWLGHRKS